MDCYFSSKYGLCHTFNSGRDGHPLLSSSSAKRNRGLHLLLDVNKANYYGMTSYFNTGIRMVIHHQDEEPMVEADGIDVMPGHMTTMKIQRTEYNSLEPPHGSACGTKDLKTSNAYTQSTCLLECNTRRVIKQCACRLLGMPDLPELNGTKYCNPKEITSCLFTNLTTMSRGDLPETVLVKYFIKYDGQPSDNPGAKCGCPKPCKQFPYKITQLNTVVLMSDSFFDDYLAAYAVIDVFAKAATNWFRRRLREDYIYLIIYYDDLNTLKTSEKLAYDFTDFGSDVGGYLGLFLGCSVLTVFEIFDFIVCYCFGRRRARSEMEQVREANERSHFV